MSLDKDWKLRNYIQHCDSPYSVVNTIAQISREKAAQCNNYILESEALTWVIQGIQPDILQQPYKNSNKCMTPYQMDYLNDTLCYIEDKQVCKAVKDSVIASQKSKYLIYLYNNIDNESKKARVRILTRMIYDTINKY